MAQKSKGARLYLRRRGGKSTWVIRHGERMVATGYGEDGLEGAERALANYASDYGTELGHPTLPSLRHPGFVYFATCDLEDYPIKIGWSTNVRARLEQLQNAHAFKMRLLATMPGTLEDERRLHIAFHELRLEGEWFKRHPDLMSIIHLNRTRDVWL